MTQPPPTAAAPDKGLIARAIGILTSPKATFETVVAHPKPAAMLFLIVLVMSIAVAGPMLTGRGQQMWLDMNVSQMQASGREIPPQSLEGLGKVAPYSAYVTAATMFIFVPIATLFFSALYWALFNAILGGTASFKQVLGIVAHAGVPGALGAVLSAPIMYAQGVMTQAGPFNLSALVPFLDQTSLIYRVLAATSVFTLWGMVATGIGLGVLYRRKSGPISIALLILYFVIMTGVMSLFSRS